MSSAAPTMKDDRRALAALLLCVFLMIAGFGVIIPLLPFYAKTFGAPPWQIAALFSAFSVGQFFAEPVWGRLSDRIGRRPVLILTMTLGALGYAALAFAPNLLAAFVIRFISGFVSGNISTIQGTLADITPPEKRAGRMGVLGSAFSAGFICGPAIGGLLARPDLGTIGFQLPLLAAAGVGLLAAAAVAIFVREPPRVRFEGPQPGRLQALGEAFRHPVIGRVLILSFIIVSGFAGIEATYGLWTEQKFGWGPQQIGMAFMVIGVIGAFAQGGLTGWLVRRSDEVSVLTGGLVLMFIGMLTQFGSINSAMAMIGFAFVCVGQSITFPNLSALISESAPSDRQGEMLGIGMSCNALARIGGPLYAGPMFSLVDPGAPFALTAILIIPAVFIALQISRRRLKAA
jgi:MFS family permease